jgi:hypothetical protein
MSAAKYTVVSQWTTFVRTTGKYWEQRSSTPTPRGRVQADNFGAHAVQVGQAVVRTTRTSVLDNPG